MSNERNNIMKVLQSIFILVLFLSLISAGCSQSGEQTQIIVPQYPGAVVSDDMDPEFAGMSVGKIKKMVTGDSYEKVFAFYKEHLKAYDPEIVTHTLEDGHQTAINIPEKDGRAITLAIQESKNEGKVAITYMRVGF